MDPQNPSFFQTYREKNPTIADWSDDQLFADALNIAPDEKVTEWQDRFPDFKERYESFFAKSDDRGIVDNIGQHARITGSGLGGSLLRGAEGATRSLVTLNPWYHVSNLLLGDDNTYAQTTEKIRNTVAGFASDAADLSDRAYGVRPETAEKFTGQLARGAGQLIGQLGTTLVNPILGIINMAGQMQNEAISDAEQTFGKKYEEFTDKERFRADTLGVLYGGAGAALEKVGLGAVFGNVIKRVAGKTSDEVVKELTVGSVGKKIAKGFLGEGVTETLQGQLLDTLAKFIYDADRDLWSAEVLEKRMMEFALGGILGGVFGGLSLPFESAVASLMKSGQSGSGGDQAGQTTPATPVTPESPSQPQQVDPSNLAADKLRLFSLNKADEELSVFEKLPEDKRNAALSEQVVKEGETSNIDRLQQMAQDFPELADRVNVLMGPPAPPSADVGGIDPNTEVVPDGDQQQGPVEEIPTGPQAEPEIFSPETTIEWDTKKNANEWKVNTGKVVGISVTTDGNQVYDVELPNGSITKVARGAARKAEELIVENVGDQAGDQTGDQTGEGDASLLPSSDTKVGDTVEWRGPSGKILTGAVVNTYQEDGRLMFRIEDEKNTYELPAEKVRPAESRETEQRNPDQVRRTRKVRPTRKLTLDQDRWIERYASAHLEHRLQDLTGDPAQRAQLVKDRRIQNEIKRDAVKRIKDAYTKPHNRDAHPLQEILASLPIDGSGLAAEVNAEIPNVLSEQDQWVASNPVRDEVRFVDKPSAKKKTAAKPKKDKSVARIHNAFPNDPVALQYALDLIQGSTKEGKVLQSLIDSGLALPSLRSMVSQLMEQAGVREKESVQPVERKKAPAGGKRKGPQDKPITSEQLDKVVESFIEEGRVVIVKRVMTKLNLGAPAAKKLISEASHRGLLKTQYVEEIPDPIHTQVYGSVSAFMKDGGVKAFQRMSRTAEGQGDPVASSLILIALRDKETDEVYVRPIMQARKATTPRVEKISYTKNGNNASAYGSHPAPIRNLPSNVEVLAIYGYEGNPTKTGYNFSSRAEFETAFEKAPRAKGRSADGTLQDVQDDGTGEPGKKKRTSGKKAGSLNAPVGDGSSERGDLIAAQESDEIDYLELANEIEEKGITEGNRWQKEFFDFWKRQEGFILRVLEIARESGFDINTLKDKPKAQQEKTLAAYTNQAIKEYYDDAITARDNADGGTEPVLRSDVEGRVGKAGVGRGRRTNPSGQPGGTPGAAPVSSTSGQVEVTGRGRKPGPNPLAGRSDDARGPNPLATEDAGQTQEGRGEQIDVSGSSQKGLHAPAKRRSGLGQGVGGVTPAKKTAAKAGKTQNKQTLFSPLWVNRLLTGWKTHRERLGSDYTELSGEEKQRVGRDPRALADKQEKILISFFEGYARKQKLPKIFTGEVLTMVYRNAKVKTNGIAELSKEMGKSLEQIKDHYDSIPDSQLSLSNENNLLSEDTTTSQRITPLTGVETAQWNNTLNILANAGIDVVLLERDATSDNDFFKSQNASYSRKKQLVQVVMNDTLNPNNRNLRALHHEAAHAVVGKEAPGLIRASDALARDLMGGRANITEEHLQRPEEATVELLAIRLEEEGFGARSHTIAERFVRYLKDLYFRVNMAIQKAVFGENAVGGATALKYFENRMRQFLAGDGDFLPSFLQEIGGPKPTKISLLIAQSEHVPGSTNSVVIGRGGELIFPDHIPTGDAVFSGGIYDAEPDQLSESNEAETAHRPPNESRAWINHAAWLEVEAIVQELAAETGRTRNEILKSFRGIDPMKEMEATRKRVPSAANAVIENMTPVEKSQVVKKVTTLVGMALHQSHINITKSGERIEKSQKRVDDEKNYISNLKNDPANAALLNEDIRKSLRKQFADYRKFAEQVGEDFKLDGTLSRVLREHEEMSGNPGQMNNELTKTFQQLTGDSAQPIRFAQALAALGLDFNPRVSTLNDLLAEIKGYKNNPSFLKLSPTQQAETSAALDTLNANPALRAVMIAFARGNALRMDALNMRFIADSGRFNLLYKTIDDLQTASDERIHELEVEVRQAVHSLTAKDRIKRDLVLHNASLRKHQRQLQQHADKKVIAEAIAPPLLIARARWGDQLGEVQVFDGGPGSVFPVMEPAKGGKILKTRTYMGWSENPDAFQIAFRDNQEWLRLNEDLKDTATYQQVKAATDRLGLDLVQKDMPDVHRNLFLRALQPLHKLFTGMGLSEGRQVGSNVLQYDATLRALIQKTLFGARKWQTSYRAVIKAAGYSGLPGEFNNKIRKHVLHHLNRESGMTNLSQAYDLAYRLVLEHVAKVGSPNKPDTTKLRGAVEAWLKWEQKNGAMWDSEREALGVAIEDKASWTVDATGKSKKMMRLKGVSHGIVMTPRRLRSDLFRDIHRRLTDLNWFGEMKDGGFLGQDKFWRKDGATLQEQQQIVQQISQAFAPAVADAYLRDNFFDPFMESEVSIFRVADEQQVASAWGDAQGDVGLFIVNLAVDTQQDVLAVADNVISALTSKANFARRIAGQSQHSAGNAQANATQTQSSHFIIDSRSDSTLPGHFFDYVQFDEYSAMGFASQLSATKHFGRGGEKLAAQMEMLKQRLHDKAAAFGDKTLLTKAEKKQKRRLEQNIKQVDSLWNKLSNYFNHADTGPYVDEKIYNELVGMLVGNVLNNPKTAITQFITPIVGPVLTFKGANLLTIGTSLSNIGTGLSEATQSVLQGLGMHFKNSPEDMQDIRMYVGAMNEAGLDFRDNITVVGKGDQFEGGGRFTLHKGLRVTRKVLDAPGIIVPGVRAKGSANRIPVRGLTGVFRWVASIANYATAVGQLKMIRKVSEQVAEYMDAHHEWDNPDFDPKSPEVLKEMLGVGYDLNALFGRADTVKQIYQQIEERFSMNFADFVRMQRQRKEQGQRQFNTYDISAIVQIAEDEISMNAGLNSRPTWFFDNKLKPITMLWGWPIMQTERVAQMATNERGEFEKRLLLKMAVTMALFAMPVSMAYSLITDLYDEFFRGRAPNLRKPGLDKSAAENALTTMERLARMGTFGMAGDVANSVVNWTDYNGGSGNPVSLDDRILVMSTVHNSINAIRNATMQRGTSYATVWRPFINSMGGNSFLQYVQLWNQATDRLGQELPGPVGGILKQEGRFTKRSNVYNIVRAAAREANLPLSQGGGFSLPSKQRMHLREMQFAALDNDSESFMENYHNAVLAYMEDGDNPRTYEDSINAVKSSWGYRHPLRTLFKQKLDDSEVALLYSKMPEGNRRDVQEAVILHEMYANLLGGSAIPIRRKGVRPVAAPL